MNGLGDVFPFPVTGWATGHGEKALWEGKGAWCLGEEDLEICKESLVWTWRGREHKTGLW